MQVNVRFLENLKLEASFDDFKILTDQPVRYKGDGTAPSPFDYFLASSALCAAYFVKVYCVARGIETEDIRVYQNNLVDPDNRYQQDFNIHIELPGHISEKDRKGILAAMDRCTVKRVIQNNPRFLIEAKDSSGKGSDIDYTQYSQEDFKTLIPGKDCTLEETITKLRGLLSELGITIEIASWRNPIPHVWSVHIRDADSPLCYTNGKGASKDAALCSALGEYLERIGNNYFYNDYYLGPEIAEADFVHYPDELWFPLTDDDSLPVGLMDEHMLSLYEQEGELKASHLIDTNSGNKERGICALPFQRQSDGEKVFIPVNLIGNLFVSNGMSAGNTPSEARVQCLSEIFERAVKNQIITEEITLPDVPKEVLERYPQILEGIKSLEEKGYPIYVKDASLGGQFPVMCVTLLNPNNGGVFASFGAHPNFEIALERSLTELLQGRSFEGLNDTALPTFNSFAVTEHNNIVDHFIDSTGVVSWKFFSSKADYEFCDWNFIGSTEEEFDHLMNILNEMDKEVYIADYEDLGAYACRILVPGYSEIYLAEDLIWDNHNRALHYREDILTLQSLGQEKWQNLLDRLEDEQLDEFMPISELIGIAFDESTPWGRLTVGELKALLSLATGNLEQAKEFVEAFLAFNDNTLERRRFYQVLNILLDIELDEEDRGLEREHYKDALQKMYGADLYQAALGSIEGTITFSGLPETNLQLHGLDKHLRLLDSYKKLINARKKS